MGKDFDISGAPPHLFLHSGHDISIMSFLQALGHAQNEIPRFASSIVIELLDNASTSCLDDCIVRVVYFNGLPSSIQDQGNEIVCLSLAEWKHKIRPCLDTAEQWNVRCLAQSGIHSMCQDTTEHVA